MFNISISISSIIKAVLFILFFISLTIPQSNVNIQVFFVGVTILFLPILYKQIRLNFNDQSFIFFSIVILIGLYGIFIGIINEVDANAMLVNTKIYIFYPIAGLWLSLLVKEFCDKEFIRNLMFLSLIFIFSLNLLALLKFFNILDILSDSFMVKNLLIFSIYEERFVLNSLNIASVPIILPFLIYFINNNPKTGNLTNMIMLICLILLIIFSGRRGIWLTTILTIASFYFFYIFKKDMIKFILKSFFSIILASIFLAYSGIFSFYDDEFDIQSERSIQSQELISAFKLKPLGNGIGSSFKTVRNDDGWIYELTWHKLLADIGLLLVVIAFFLIYLTYIYIRKSYQRSSKEDFNYLLASTIAMYMVLIASSTNPYVLNLDGFIGLGLLIGLIDRMRNHNKFANHHDKY